MINNILSAVNSVIPQFVAAIQKPFTEGVCSSTHARTLVFDCRSQSEQQGSKLSPFLRAFQPAYPALQKPAATQFQKQNDETISKLFHPGSTLQGLMYAFFLLSLHLEADLFD